MKVKLINFKIDLVDLPENHGPVFHRVNRGPMTPLILTEGEAPPDSVHHSELITYIIHKLTARNREPVHFAVQHDEFGLFRDLEMYQKAVVEETQLNVAQAANEGGRLEGKRLGMALVKEQFASMTFWQRLMAAWRGRI